MANELEKWFFGFEERIERNFFFCSTFISYYFIFICSTEPNLFFFPMPWNEILKICIIFESMLGSNIYD